MADNYLKRLVAEWYELQGYYVRRNVHVGRRPSEGIIARLVGLRRSPSGNGIARLFGRPAEAS
jgi:hypothetical protein